MGRSAYQKQRRLGGGKALTPFYGQKTQMGPYGPLIVTPSRLPEGWQAVKLKIPMKIVTCAQVNCEIFVKDRIDPITQKIIPAGTKFCGAVHKIWDGRPPIYGIQFGGQDTIKFVDEDEFVTRLVEGIDAGLQFIKQG